MNQGGSTASYPDAVMTLERRFSLLQQKSIWINERIAMAESEYMQTSTATSR
jgi:hypothetical protein